MKRMNLAMAASCLLAVALTACNDSGTQSETSTSTTTSTDSMNANNSTTTTPAENTSTAPTAPRTPLTPADSSFVMKAAMGGLMEVEAGNIAQQNATHDRVKAFGAMMVADHSKANAELSALATSRGMTLPTALPADKQKHMEDMKKMQGKAFDKHYVNMMLNDHKKDVADFEKQAASGNDAELKAWAEKTLPTLKMHRDSVMALSKVKM